MDRSPIDIAVDEILQGADGDIRLALRTVLLLNLELQVEINRLTEQLRVRSNPAQTFKSFN